MALWQVDFFILPKISLSEISNLKISEDLIFDDASFWDANKTNIDFFEGMGDILPKSKSWSNYITLFGSENSNRVEVLSKDGIVESVSLRIDFTSNYEFVYKGIIDFCILKGLIILDQNLQIVSLNYEIAKNIVENAPEVETYNYLLNKTQPRVKIIAHIKLYENGRKTPFYTGYRPLFNFINNMKTSGQINLINQDQFNPGEDGEVEITFLNQKYLGEDFNVGKIFFFGEGVSPLGEGIVKAIL